MTINNKQMYYYLPFKVIRIRYYLIIQITD